MKKLLIFVLLLAVGLGLHSDLLSAQDAAKKVIAITGGRLLTVSHGTIENGVLVMADGKIAAVGEAGKVTIPNGAQVVDAHGMTVYPGLIDPETVEETSEIEAIDVDGARCDDPVTRIQDGGDHERTCT